MPDLVQIDPKELARRFPAFGAEADAIAPVLEPVQLAAGEVLLREGAASDSAWLVWDGALGVTLGIRGEPVEVGRFGPGAIVGEASLLDAEPATATVAAAAPTVALRLGWGALLRLRGENPAAAAAVLRAICRSLASRVRAATDRLESLAPPRPERRGMLEALLGLLGGP